MFSIKSKQWPQIRWGILWILSENLALLKSSLFLSGKMLRYLYLYLLCCAFESVRFVCEVNKAFLYLNLNNNPRLCDCSLNVSVYVICNIVSLPSVMCLILANSKLSVHWICYVMYMSIPSSVSVSYET